MEQPLGFVAKGDFDLVCELCLSLYALKQSPRGEVDHSTFCCQTSPRKCVYVII